MPSGRVIAEAATVVLANAADALRLLQATHWPVQPVRGQISLCARLAAAAAALPRCRWPVPATCCPRSTARLSSAPARSRAMTTPRVRDADHRFNLQRLHG